MLLLFFLNTLLHKNVWTNSYRPDVLAVYWAV